MASESTTRTRVVERASTAARKQREGTKFTGAFGQRTGDSDLLFVEGQLPKQNGTVSNDAPASKQLELCLENLKSVLAQHGHTVDDVLQITLYLADMDTYEQVNETYEQYFDETYPARTTIGVCELLGGATVTIDAVVTIE